MVTSATMAQQAPQSDKDVKIRQLQRQLDLYKEQQQTLNRVLLKSKENEAEAVVKVKELSSRLQALGMYEGDKDERLLQAIADGRVLNNQLTELRVAGEAAAAQFRIFSKRAQVNDPPLRQKAEVAIRKLEKVLWGGVENKPKVDQLGTIQSAKVISIDAQSGMLVINVGSKMESAVGMTYRLNRGGRELGEAIVSSVRKNISGLLVVSKSHKDVVFRVGDKAQVKLQPR